MLNEKRRGVPPDSYLDFVHGFQQPNEQSPKTDQTDKL